MPTVYIPTPMRRFVVNKSHVQLRAGPITAVLSELDAKHPGIKEQIYDEKGNIKKYINVFVNGCDIRTLNGETTVTEENDEIYIVPALAGG